MKAAAGFVLPLLLVLAFPARAETPKLGWPLSCTRGQDCWIVHHVDVDPAEGTARDFTCGALTYDGHKGTDIAIRDRAIMKEGRVSVLAAADGTVLRLRDAVEDDGDVKTAKEDKQECGNGVIIAHGGGWETQYCHMKKGSIAVKPGQAVRKGDRLGAVGQSGAAEFPHLHLQVTKDDTIVDPFTGQAWTSGCGRPAGAAGLWEKPFPYDPAIFYAAGFADMPPDPALLAEDASSSPRLPANPPALIFWFLLYGARAGDDIRMEIRAPDGSVFAESAEPQPTNKIRLMRYTGKRTRSDTHLVAGVYTGKATLARRMADGTVVKRVVEKKVVVGKGN